MSAEETEQLAAQWLAREDRGLSAEEALALEAWLAQATLNRVAWLRLKAGWTRAERLAALRGAAPAPEVRKGLRSRLLLAIAACLALMVGGGALLAWKLAAKEQVFATGVGGMQAVRLADGSRMELNTNTRVHADVTAARRTVTLESGEAYFDVVHDARHPFTVYAGNRRITDLGTKFSVYRNADDVRVLVREGRVRVDILDKPEVDAPVVAEAGHAVIAKGGETLVMAKPDIANDLSWRSGMLVFSQQPLGEAAEQFNRYNSRKIVVEGEARKIRIGGSFKADNVDVFVLLLHQGFGLSVNDQGKRITVSR
ncbi:MAG: iron dicitrate transport regulator FecR [Alphaproteobacteria bacterium]|nr:iron dicitrate transport regulator FecR [Alphaproteobacteria bacterium]